MMVTMRHALTIPGFSARRGFCRRGMRAWFERHGLDYAAFKREGLPAEQFAATGDGMAEALVRWAEESEGRAHGE